MASESSHRGYHPNREVYDDSEDNDRMDHDRSSLSSGGEAPDDEEEDERPKERQRRKKTSSASYRYYDQMRGHSSGLGDAKNHHDNYAQETEYDWLFDYLYSVFKAPSWEQPLQEFIDENCTVFDNDDENKLAYTELHDRFRSLVEDLLEKHLEQIGISAEDFVEICQKTTSPGCRHLNQLVLDKIVAMDDFEVFKRMMQRRNMELEAEALRELRKMGVNTGGHSAQSDHAGDDSGSSLKQTNSSMNMEELQETADLEAALANSLLEYDQQRAESEIEMADLEQAIRQSLAYDEQRLESLQEAARQPQKNETEQQRIKEEIRSTEENISQARSAIEEHQEELKNMKSDANATKVSALETAGKDADTLLKERTEHLKRQREMLRARKQGNSENAEQQTSAVYQVAPQPPPPEKDIHATVAALKKKDDIPADEGCASSANSSKELPVPDKDDRFRNALAASAKHYLSEKPKNRTEQQSPQESSNPYANHLQEARQRRRSSQESVAKRLAELSAARAKRMQDTAPSEEDG